MGKLSKTLPVAALAVLGTLIFFSRLHTYEEPLERDLTTYAVIAHEMVDGKALYSELWDHKPPAIHATYAIAELIAGYGRDSIFLMNVVVTLATLVACYFAGSAAGGGRTGGLVAAALWTIASGDLALEGNQPNTEVFLNALLAGAFAILVRNNQLGLRRALVVGLLFAAASLYKQIVVVQAALLALAYLACSSAGSRKKAFVEVTIVGATGAAAWALVLGYFTARRRSEPFVEAVFTYNRWYAGSIWQNLSHLATWQMMAPDALAVLLSLATLCVAGIVLGLVFGPRREWILLCAFLIATDLSILLPGHFFRHYYQLWLPPLAIGAGWTIALLRRVLPQRLSRLSYVVATVVCAILVMLEIPYYRLSAEGWSLRKYGRAFVETDRLAAKIDNLLSAGTTFYEWGNESGFYFTSGRRPPSGIIFAFPTMAGPLTAKLSQRLLNDLERTKPELIVAESSTLRGAPLDHPMLIWFNENYRLLSKGDMFSLYARKGSNLDRMPPPAVN